MVDFDPRLLSDPQIIAALAVAGALLILAAALIFRRPRTDHLTESLAELQGRLAQMAGTQAASQASMAERLQTQERALIKGIEERLSALGQRVGDKLQQQATEATKSLADLQARLAVIDAAQKNITELSSQVVGLQDILANKQARGAFGEIQMQDLVQSVLPPSAYCFQATMAGGQRADCLLLLPNPPGPIALDAKFPLESYRALKDAKSETALVQARRSFSKDIRDHVVTIAEKYIRPGETADSALMFLPSEAVYAELHASFPNLVEESYRRRVWIVSPTTLMATLTTVRAILKDVRLREQAHLIRAEMHALSDDIQRLDERVGKLQRHFEQATEDVRQVRISTEKIGKRAERMEELQLGNSSLEPELGAVEPTPSPEPRRLIQ